MTVTFRTLVTTVPCLLILSCAGFAQVPAGVPYEPGKHPNPVVTWVSEKDFRKVSFAEGADKVGVELMSLSKDQGERESVELASPSSSRQKVRIIGQEYEVTFYPVLRQNYKLKTGKTFALYTFRFPRAFTSADVLNRAAFGRPPRGTVPRFGPVPVPDRIEIRGVPGLYMDDGKQRTVYWFELGAGYSVTTDASRDELFKALEDLL